MNVQYNYSQIFTHSQVEWIKKESGVRTYVSSNEEHLQETEDHSKV